MCHTFDGEIMKVLNREVVRIRKGMAAVAKNENGGEKFLFLERKLKGVPIFRQIHPQKQSAPPAERLIIFFDG